MFLVCILKREILLHKIGSFECTKNLNMYTSNLSIPKTNFGSADGLGMSSKFH